MLAVLLAFVLGQIVGPLHIEEEEDGPQISFASTRDQVFYCDFSSPVCSDGRVITTTRSTPVPCEKEEGIWLRAEVNEGCYNWRGELESWRQNTSYLAYGAELDKSPWTSISGGVLEPLPDGWLVRRPEGAIHAAAWIQVRNAVAESETWTLSCIMRAGTNDTPRLRLGSAATPEKKFDVTESWGAYTFTGTVPQDAQPGVRIYPGNPNETIEASVGVKACWLAKASSPGRPCWDSEAPVTCGTDFHRMPSTLLPSTNGEISVSLTLHSPLRGDTALRGILWADGAPVPNRISIAEDGRIRVYDGTNGFFTSAVTWEVGRKYHVRVVISPEQWRVYRDGVLIGSSPSLGQIVWPASVRIADLLDGSISYLSVRNYE